MYLAKQFLYIFYDKLQSLFLLFIHNNIIIYTEDTHALPLPLNTQSLVASPSLTET